jgi:AAA domain
MIPGTKEPTITEIKLAEARSDGIGTRLSEVKPERVAWLWQDRIPLGKLTVFDGDPEVGKSSVTLDIAARVTTGRDMPDDSPGVAGAVVILSYEDGVADTIIPRLNAAGCDLRRVVAIERLPDEKGTIRPPMIPEDLETCEAVIKREGAVMLIVDPLMAALGGKVDAHRDQDVRRALALIADMAERTGVAVVVVRHMNKSGGGNPMYRGGGSIGIIGAARSALLFGRHPDDPERRVMARLKGNLAPGYPSLSYTMEGTEIASEDGSIVTVRVVWEGETSATAADLLQPPETDDESARDRAIKFLKTYLASGEKSAVEVEVAAEEADISIRTLKRAKKAAGARSVKKPGGWVWRLHVSDPELTTRHRLAREPIGTVVPLGNLARGPKGVDEPNGTEPQW